mmetsp:Transcript_86198/g.243452  ORF Transcript_86198/g.243452 Transcript_86198/m.243452 type:complete len:228 (+) Transcript_86198:427-1110(+)
MDEGPCQSLALLLQKAVGVEIREESWLARAPFACVANLALIRRGVRLAHRQTRLCPQVVPCLGLRCTRATRVLAPLLARALARFTICPGMLVVACTAHYNVGRTIVLVGGKPRIAVRMAREVHVHAVLQKESTNGVAPFIIGEGAVSPCDDEINLARFTGGRGFGEVSLEPCHIYAVFRKRASSVDAAVALSFLAGARKVGLSVNRDHVDTRPIKRIPHVFHAIALH